MADRPSDDGQPIWLLCVDDETDLLEITKHFLESSAGFKVVTSPSVVNALGLLKLQEFDAILCDYQMPEYNGLDFLKRLRGVGNSIPFILFTGRGREEVVIQALNMGADYYIQKGGDVKSQFAEVANIVRHAVVRRRAEIALRRRQGKLDGLFKAAPMGIGIVNRRFFVEVNERMTAITGYPQDELIGRNIRFIYPSQEEYERVGQEFYGQIERNGTGSIETKWVRRDGRVVEVLISGTAVNPHDSGEGVIFGALDMSDIRRAAEKDRLRTLELITLLNSLPGYAFYKDAELRYVTANEPLCKALGLTRESIAGKTDFDLYPPDVAERYLAEDKEIITGAREGMRSEEEVMEDGRRISLATSRVPMKDPEGRIIGLIGLKLNVTDLKTAEEALRESEERWKFALEGSRDGVWDWDLQGDTLFFSRRWKEMIGFDEDELPNTFDSWHSRVHPDDEAMVTRKLNRQLEGKSPFYQVEYRLRCKDDSYKWVMARGMVVSRDQSGNPLRMIGTHTDISDRKRSEAALAASERRFRSIFESMNEGLALHQMVYDEQGRPIDYRIMDANPVYERIVGKPIGKVRGKLATEVYGMGAPPYLEAYAQVAESGTGMEMDTYFEPLRRWFHISVASSERGSFATIFFDTTKNTELEEALRKSETSLRLVTDNVVDMIMQVDPDRRAVYVSPSVKRVIGIDPSELLGRDPYTRVHPSDLPGLLAASADAVGQKMTELRLEFRYMKRDGEYLWLESEIRFLYDPQGGYQGALYVSREISDRKRAEEAARIANQKLELLNSVTRHDIHNQIAVVTGFLELSRGSVDDPRVREYLGKIGRAAQNIQRQIDFMRDYQRMGAQAPYWQDATATFENAARAFDLKGIELSATADGVEVFADALLEKAFYNLIDNSLRHGGALTRISLSKERRGSEMLLIYQDDGGGVAAREKSNIFKRGYGKNTGYGLFLTDQILELTGIGIIENGTPGKGARFELEVPEGAWRTTKAAR